MVENFNKQRKVVGKVSTSVKSTWTVNRSQGNSSQIRVDQNRSNLNQSKVSKEFDRSLNLNTSMLSQSAGTRDIETAKTDDEIKTSLGKVNPTPLISSDQVNVRLSQPTGDMLQKGNLENLSDNKIGQGLDFTNKSQSKNQIKVNSESSFSQIGVKLKSICRKIE